MNLRRFLYFSALLFLPALLVALSATGKADSGSYTFVKVLGVSSMVTLFVLIIPIGLCITCSIRPQWFVRWRVLGWIAGIMVFSWVYLNAMIWIPCALGIYSIQGPEVVFAMFLGWFYLPIASLPVLTIYATVQVMRGKIPKRIVLRTVAVLVALCCAFLIRRQYNSRKTPPPPSPHADQIHQPNRVTDALKNDGGL